MTPAPVFEFRVVKRLNVLVIRNTNKNPLQVPYCDDELKNELRSELIVELVGDSRGRPRAIAGIRALANGLVRGR